MSEEQATQETQEQEQTQSEQDKKPANSGSAFYKQKLADASAEAEKLRAELEKIQTAQLTEKESFKELYELEKSKREQAEAKNKELSSTVFNTFKTSAIKEAALKAGILESAVEDLDIIDNSMVEVETTDRGSINVIGASDFVESLKERKPHWFKKMGAPTINNGTPGDVPPAQLTGADIIKMQKENPAKYAEYMQKRLGRK